MTQKDCDVRGKVEVRNADQIPDPLTRAARRPSAFTKRRGDERHRKWTYSRMVSS